MAAAAARAGRALVPMIQANAGDTSRDARGAPSAAARPGLPLASREMSDSSDFAAGRPGETDAARGRRKQEEPCP